MLFLLCSLIAGPPLYIGDAVIIPPPRVQWCCLQRLVVSTWLVDALA